MKKVILIAGVMATIMTLIVGCGNQPKSPVDIDVEVEVESQAEEKADEEWIRYTFWSDDISRARRQAEDSQYWHLDQGETVSELIETTDEVGHTIFYFKVRVAG